MNNRSCSTVLEKASKKKKVTFKAEKRKLRQTKYFSPVSPSYKSDGAKQMVAYPGCTINGSWLPAAKQRELLQQSAQRVFFMEKCCIVEKIDALVPK